MNPQSDPSSDNNFDGGLPQPQLPSPLPAPSATPAPGSFVAPGSDQSAAPGTPEFTVPQPQANDAQQIPAAPAGAYQPPAGQPAMPQAPSPTYNAQQSLHPPKRKRPGKKLLAALVIALLLGLGGSAYAYVRVLNNSPEKVLADALANTMTDVLDRKPLQVVSDMTLKFQHDNQDVTITVHADAKRVEENGEFMTRVRVQAGSRIDITASGSLVTEGVKTVYVKLNDLRQTAQDIVRTEPWLQAELDQMMPIIQKIDNRWIKIDEQSLSEFGAIESDDVVDKCTKALEELRISTDDQKRIKEIFLQNQFAIASEELPSETIDGDSSYHYKLDLNEEAGMRFAKEVIELGSFSAVTSACEVKQEDIDKQLEDLRRETDKEEELLPAFELWVSKSKRYPTRLKVTDDNKETSIEWTTNSKIDAQHLAINIPVDAISIRELRAEIEEALSSSTPQGRTQGWSIWR